MTERFIDRFLPEEPYEDLFPGTRIIIDELSPFVKPLYDKPATGTVIGPDDKYPELGYYFVKLDHAVFKTEEDGISYILTLIREHIDHVRILPSDEDHV